MVHSSEKVRRCGMRPTAAPRFGEPRLGEASQATNPRSSWRTSPALTSGPRSLAVDRPGGHSSSV